jgi:hypothetical protein
MKARERHEKKTKEKCEERMDESLSPEAEHEGCSCRNK